MLRAFPARTAMLAGIGLALAGTLIPAGSADARVFVGIGVPFYAPYYYPPPVYYPPPPVYYTPPPPVVYAPPASASSVPPRSAGQTCYASGYSCPMERPTSPGAACYCRSNAGERIWGQAN